jgi:hypothetical protein
MQQCPPLEIPAKSMLADVNQANQSKVCFYLSKTTLL